MVNKRIINKFFGDVSVKSKLMLIVAITLVIGLLINSFAVSGFVYKGLKEQTISKIKTAAEVVAWNSAAALAFNDPESAGETLLALQSKASVTYATLYDQSLTLFREVGEVVEGSKLRDDLLHSHLRLAKRENGQPLILEKDGFVHIVLPVKHNGVTLGFLHISSSLQSLQEKLFNTISIISLISIVTLFLALFLTFRIQRLISIPLQKLTSAMRAVALEKNYSNSVEKLGNDELGELVDVFNDMLKQIQERDNKLALQIKERTEALDQVTLAEQQLINAQKIAKLSSWIWNYSERTLFLPPATREMFSISDSPHLSQEEWQSLIHEDDRESVGKIFKRAIESQDSLQLEYRMLLFGKVVSVAVNANIIRDNQGDCQRVEGTIQDISERKGLEAKLHQLAYFDSLTDLPNRESFTKYASDILDTARLQSTKVAILFIDLDNFKRVNDTLGHEIGDQLLKKAAGRIKHILRDRDQIVSVPARDQGASRFGGDEFTVILEDIENDSSVENVARRILSNFKTPMTLDDGQHSHEVFVSGSVGISVFPKDGSDLTSLLKCADSAMYEAKKSGKNTFHFFSSHTNEHTRERLGLETDLRKALSRNELVLHYQPRFDVQSHRVMGFEALVRWQHPSKGLIPPDKFISIAEETGIILEIGEWVLEEACRYTMELHQKGFKHLNVAVNISSIQLYRTNLVGVVKNICRKIGFDCKYLELELTESILMHNEEKVHKDLKDLKSLGLHLAVDDFGTGYSSLSYLKQFPLDALKIDRSFVRDIGVDSNDEAIVTAILAMAKSLGLRVVAEGVESKVHMKFLEGLHCDELQGYLISKPLPASAVLAFLENDGFSEYKQIS